MPNEKQERFNASYASTPDAAKSDDHSGADTTVVRCNHSLSPAAPDPEISGQKLIN